MQTLKGLEHNRAESESLIVSMRHVGTINAQQQMVEGWLASRAHCANQLNPQFRELGAAFAVELRSDAGIYSTAWFGAAYFSPGAWPAGAAQFTLSGVRIPIM